MKVESRWKLTLDPAGTPRVILDFGELIDGELPWGLENATEVVDLISAHAPFLRDVGNSRYMLNFTVFRRANTDTLARTAIMDALTTETSYGKKPLRVQIADSAGPVSGVYWQFASTLCQSFAPIRVVEAGLARYAYSYSIIATGLTKHTS